MTVRLGDVLVKPTTSTPSPTPSSSGGSSVGRRGVLAKVLTAGSIFSFKTKPTVKRSKKATVKLKRKRSKGRKTNRR